jgi:predicted phage-related endonuclease
VVAEKIIGEDLFPTTYSNGFLSCSCDGITMMEDIAWENKQFNKDLAESLRQGILPEHHWPQAQQNLMVTGAEKLLFMTSDGTEENSVYMWVIPDQEYQQRIRDGWIQFQKDLENYQHIEEQTAPAGKAPDALPALRIEVTGMVTASNIDAFKSHAVAVFDGIKTDLQSDEDFADAEKTVKFCKEVEDRLTAAKDHALSQTESIDALFRAIDEISEIARQKRLTLDKLVKTRKDSIRIELIQAAQKELEQHLIEINLILGSRLVNVTAPFADVIKGKKTVASIKDALATALANAKIESSAMARLVERNRDAARDHKHLFPDFAAVCLKPADDFEALVKARIADEKARQDAEIERRAKEAAEAQRKAQEKAAADAIVTEVAAETHPVTVAKEAIEVSQPANDDTPEQIIAFLHDKNFIDHSRIRGILVEYEKFKAQQSMQEAA